MGNTGLSYPLQFRGIPEAKKSVKRLIFQGQKAHKMDRSSDRPMQLRARPVRPIFYDVVESPAILAQITALYCSVWNYRRVDIEAWEGTATEKS
jgi:hypothetical protein